MAPADEAPTPLAPAALADGELPANVAAGAGQVITGELAFKRFQSRRDAGARDRRAAAPWTASTSPSGERAVVEIGDYCYFTNAVLLCELDLRIGSYVVIGWNATIADTDFHPLAPALRIADAVACSPLAQDRPAAADRAARGGRSRTMSGSGRTRPS